MTRERLVGVVVSNKMEKTVAVLVSRKSRHPKLHKLVRKDSQFLANDDLGVAVGDRVVIEETRPLSKRKRWRIVGAL